MLTEKKIVMEAKTVVNEVEICNMTAIIKVDTEDVSFHNRMLDKVACKDHRVTLRADQAEFEDMAYQLLDDMIAQKNA